MTVLREIPPELVEGIRKGIYTISGGTIRHAAGTPYGGEIVGHLLFKNADVMQEIGQKIGQVQGLNSLQALQMASVVLQGINLAVSLAGFTIVCGKLNKMSQQLSQIDAKIDIVIQTQKRQLWEDELIRRSELGANLENLAAGLRLGDVSRTGGALNDLTKSASFYQLLCESLCADRNTVCSNVEVLREGLQYVFGLRLAIAQAYGHRSEYDEALLQISTLRDWHLRIVSSLPMLLSEEAMAALHADLSEALDSIFAAYSDVDLIRLKGKVSQSSELARLARFQSVQRQTQKSLFSFETGEPAISSYEALELMLSIWSKFRGTCGSFAKKKEIQEWREFQFIQEALVEALVCLEEHYALCKHQNLTLTQLASMISDDESFAYLKVA